MQSKDMLYGDGRHDDTIALQEKLDGCGIVTVDKPGTYLISKTLIIHSNTRFILSPGVDSRAIIQFECGARCGNIVIRDIHRREEQATAAPLLKISPDTVIDRLVLENISQSAADGVTLATIEIDGEINELVTRDVIE